MWNYVRDLNEYMANLCIKTMNPFRTPFWRDYRAKVCRKELILPAIVTRYLREQNIASLWEAEMSTMGTESQARWCMRTLHSCCHYSKAINSFCHQITAGKERARENSRQRRLATNFSFCRSPWTSLMMYCLLYITIFSLMGNCERFPTAIYSYSARCYQLLDWKERCVLLPECNDLENEIRKTVL